MRSTSFETMWTTLAALGRDPQTGGYRRYAWTPALRACESWFTGEAVKRGLTVEADGNGNTIAWWRPGPLPLEGGVVTGSHLDSVPDGGAYDGPLGVVSALAALDLLGERGIRPVRPLGVAVFVEEEGARFGLSCLGSRLMTGDLAADQARLLRDADGILLPEAVAATGLEPRLGPSLGLLHEPAAFVELHLEQGRALADVDAPVGLATGIWPHGRWRFTFTGVANHAGTTRMADRHDPMLTYAMTALAANKRARLAETGAGTRESSGTAEGSDVADVSGAAGGSGARATFGRVEVAPNGVNAIARTVTAWLDARASDEPALRSLVDDIARQAHDRAARDGTTLDVVAESVTPAVVFDEGLRERLARRLGDPPMLPTQAGHDAGILATAGIPAAMLFVRNPSGVSHSPAEYADPADCDAGVRALADALAELLT